MNFEDETGESVTGLRITLESGIIVKFILQTVMCRKQLEGSNGNSVRMQNARFIT